MITSIFLAIVAIVGFAAIVRHFFDARNSGKAVCTDYREEARKYPEQWIVVLDGAIFHSPSHDKAWRVAEQDSNRPMVIFFQHREGEVQVLASI